MIQMISTPPHQITTAVEDGFRYADLDSYVHLPCLISTDIFDILIYGILILLRISIINRWQNGRYPFNEKKNHSYFSSVGNSFWLLLIM